jgi:anti-anti-sigma regulatory factor
LLYPAVSRVLGLSLSSRGELDIAAAPIMREKLLAILAPAASRLIFDLSAREKVRQI